MKASHFPKGFTLIELLVVIAVIGVLAGAIIVAVNPVEQLRRSRDAARKSTTQQLANAVSAFYAARGGVTPAESTTWISSLVSAGELRGVPAAVTAAGYTSCTGNAHNGFCYRRDAAGVDYIVFSRLESTVEISKCSSGQIPYYLFSSSQAQSGTVCSSADPTAMSGWTFISP